MADEPEAPLQRTRQFPCRSCGATAEYVPRVGLKCSFCGHTTGAPENEDKLIEEWSFESYLTSPHARRGYGTAIHRQIVCRGCGAESRIGQETAASACAFCGSPIVAEDRPEDDAIRPEAVVPFQITKQQALDRFSAWVSSLWFAPTALKRLRETDRIAGVYRPYWTFDAATDSFYQGERGEYYYVTVSYTDTEYVGGKPRTVTKTRQERRTRWYPASGRVTGFFDDVLVFGGRQIGRDTKYNLAELCPYDPGFLAGWQAERYAVPPDRAWPVAKGEIDGRIHSMVEDDIGGDEQRVHAIKTSYNAVKFKHLLLPLYLASYFYRGKVFRFQVNGQSGEVAGERPYSFWKIFLLVVGILAAIAAVWGIVALSGR